MVEIVIVAPRAYQSVINNRLKMSSIPYKNLVTGETFNGYSGKKTHSVGDSSPAMLPPTNYVQLTEEQTIKQLDDIWEEQAQELQKLTLDNNYLLLIQTLLRTHLFPHQSQGVAWMLGKELNNNLPPFYEEKNYNGKSVYYHQLLRHEYSERPKSFRGGCNCDDMGLGKSLMAIAVILANPPSGKTFHIDVSWNIY